MMCVHQRQTLTTASDRLPPPCACSIRCGVFIAAASLIIDVIHLSILASARKKRCLQGLHCVATQPASDQNTWNLTSSHESCLCAYTELIIVLLACRVWDVTRLGVTPPEITERGITHRWLIFIHYSYQVVKVNHLGVHWSIPDDSDHLP